MDRRTISDLEAILLLIFLIVLGGFVFGLMVLFLFSIGKFIGL